MTLRGGSRADSTLASRIVSSSHTWCAAVPRRARIQGAWPCVSLNSRLESNEEEETWPCVKKRPQVLSPLHTWRATVEEENWLCVQRKRKSSSSSKSPRSLKALEQSSIKAVVFFNVINPAVPLLPCHWQVISDQTDTSESQCWLPRNNTGRLCRCRANALRRRAVSRAPAPNNDP